MPATDSDILNYMRKMPEALRADLLAFLGEQETDAEQILEALRAKSQRSNRDGALETG